MQFVRAAERRNVAQPLDLRRQGKIQILAPGGFFLLRAMPA
jgi:hypothetical protein